MVLVFILCAIFIIITLLVILLILSTLKFKIEDFEASNIQNEERHILPKYRFKISLYLFNKVRWFSISLNSKKISNIYEKMKLGNIDFKTLQKDFKFEDLRYIKTLNPKISFLNLSIKLGLEDTLITTFIIFVISTVISILLPYTIKKYEKDKYYYQVLPLYANKNVYEIKLDCIIEIKMVHIINIIYVLSKKRRVDKNEQRASNRGSYGYGYE